MARPKIGIFGAMMAVGGLLTWRWAQRRRASQANLNRDLSRWEGEGGAVTTATQTAPASLAASVSPARNGAANGSGNGASHPGGTGDAWPFPHGS